MSDIYLRVDNDGFLDLSKVPGVEPGFYIVDALKDGKIIMTPVDIISHRPSPETRVWGYVVGRKSGK